MKQTLAFLLTAFALLSCGHDETSWDLAGSEPRDPDPRFDSLRRREAIKRRRLSTGVVEEPGDAAVLTDLLQQCMTSTYLTAAGNVCADTTSTPSGCRIMTCDAYQYLCRANILLEIAGIVSEPMKIGTTFEYPAQGRAANALLEEMAVDDAREAIARASLQLRNAGGLTTGYSCSNADLNYTYGTSPNQIKLGRATYRWTTALNGFAVRLTDEQARELEAADDVALVEPNQVRRVTGSQRAEPALGLKGPRRGGAGMVVGVIDTGLAPENPLFSAAVRLGKEPRGFSGTCQVGEGWDADDCDDKVVGARWFVDGFGEEQLRSTAYLSPRDSDGHGTQMASIAAGNADVPVRVGGKPMGRYGGMAPQARIAVYKACWGAPDPARDGCATADLVTAIDRASGDGVDVISLAVGGPPEIDTVERALLGAAEADIVVAAAAGNAGTNAYAAHPSPWVTTVGGTTGRPRLGRVVASGGPRLQGAMVSTRGVRPARLVLSERVPAKGASRADARVCAPDSLDARRVAGAIVLCQRGSVGRVDKSRTVRLADGAGMVLVNVSPGSVSADFHGVPTVHLADDQGRVLRRWAARHPGGRVALRPVGLVREPRAVARWSSPGSPLAGVLKPDLVAPAAGVLGAVPGTEAWDFVTGTSAAAAYTAGAAATLLARTGWPATTVRSALATTAAPLPGDVLHSGSGRLRPDAAARPGLVYEIDSDDYRAWLSGRQRRLNTPSVLLADGQRRTRRAITNIADRALYFSSSAVGFGRDVSVRPAAVRLDAGESATFVIRVRDSAARSDDGDVVWRGATGTVTSIPVQISR